MKRTNTPAGLGLPLLLISISAWCAEPNLAGIVDMELPLYTFRARRSPGGTIQALVTVGKTGRARSVKTTGGDEGLAAEVKDTLTEAATYDPKCKGSKVELIFTFQLEGAPTPNPHVYSRFRPPNHFILTSQPQSVHVRLAPPKPEVK